MAEKSALVDDARVFFGLAGRAAVNSNEGELDALLEICHSQDAYVCCHVTKNTKFQLVRVQGASKVVSFYMWVTVWSVLGAGI